jgi:hypothetical protein
MKEKEYVRAVERIQIPDTARERILRRVLEKNSEKEKKYMWSKKKFGVIAAAATLVLGITVFAAGGVISSWHGSSSSKPDYTSLPTAEECVKDAGYAPALMASFENGYSFETGNVVKNSLKDDGGNTVEKFKSFSFRYGKEGDTVLFSQEKYTSQMTAEGELLDSVDGYDIYYNSYTNKTVPGDYVLTDEDKAAEEKGELVFSYGADDVSTSQVQSVFWSKGDMHYSLMQTDGDLSAQELLNMAKEVIAAF